MKQWNATLISFFILISFTRVSGSKRGLIAKLEDRLEGKLQELSTVVTKWLEAFNDRQLIGTSLGRLIQYEKIKPHLQMDETTSARSKKMSMSMMPMIFHLGAMSTWMLLTAIMATKSVAIGVLLLVFKIAVTAAKLSTFFSGLKGKKHQEWTPPAHYEPSHDYARSMTFLDPPTYMESPPSFEGYSYHPPSHGGASAGSYSPDWSPSEPSLVSGGSSGYYYR